MGAGLATLPPYACRMIYLPRLRQLHAALQAEGETRRKFPSRHGFHSFNVVFLSDENPMVLHFGLIERQPFAFELDVDVNYKINAFLGILRKSLMDALGLRGRSREPVCAERLLLRVRSEYPRRCCTVGAGDASGYSPHQGCRRGRQTILFGWHNHDGITSNVSTANLAKKLFLLGSDAHDRCARSNISSRWSEEAIRDHDYFPPQ